MCRSNTAAWPLATQIQAFLAVNPVCLLVIDQPTLAPQQHVDAFGTIANPGSGDFLDPLPFGSVVPRTGAVKIGRLP